MNYYFVFIDEEHYILSSSLNFIKSWLSTWYFDDFCETIIIKSLNLKSGEHFEDGSVNVYRVA